MEALFLCLWTIFCFFLGSFLAKLRIVRKSLRSGGFGYRKYYFRTLIERADQPKYGEPEALKDFPSSEPLFAQNTLSKIKFLNQDTKAKLLMAEHIALKLEGKGFFEYLSDQEHDCIQCYLDEGKIPSCAVACQSCGDRHCDKAQNHIRLCKNEQKLLN